jgi:hypothetical protein
LVANEERAAGPDRVRSDVCPDHDRKKPGIYGSE